MTRRRVSRDSNSSIDTTPVPQIDLFTHVGAFGWPAVDEFPYNQDGLTVGSVVRADLARSRSPLVVTGYASLERLIEWLSEFSITTRSSGGEVPRVRLLLGHEPHPTSKEEWNSRRYSPSREIADHWLHTGVSLLLSGKILAVLDLLREGTLEVRTSGERPIHAKIYVGADAVTVGSSNFSQSGLASQIEANARFTTAKEPERYSEAARLAEMIWQQGEDYTAGFERLLRALLRKVTWKEALARACAELLEGTWAARYASGSSVYDGPALWPSQEQGIAHALWILENQGSVLVADATGSGKTLMGVHLVKRIMNRIWRTGRARSDLAVLMAPPSILPAWDREAIRCGLALEKYSQGHLSRSHGAAHSTLAAAVRRAQLLVIDEAHNFLRRSNRTHALYSNMADHVLLFTATPINRGPEDLLAIVDLLGADNLDDDTLKAVEVLWRRRRSSHDQRHASQREQLRRAIRQFTLRRTKSDLNHLVSREPERYRTSTTGRICHYPEHQAEGYPLNESEQDRQIAAEVRQLAGGLKGLSRLTAPLELPSAFASEGMSEESYLAQRLHSAAALARHDVAAALRSSRARLLEHLEGTASAVASTPTLSEKKFAEKKIGVLQRTRHISGSPPPLQLVIPVPEWLRNPAAHAAACEDECALYERISGLARELSDRREREKVELLIRLMKEQSLVLAFDSYLISLHDLDTRIRAHPAFRPSHEVIVATGDAPSARKHLYASFGPGSAAKDVIALCSDALSESVNLQAASTVVMLDTPSVIRVAEQRIGRVDRMNSSHDVVRALWPIDAPEFALKSSERLVERHRLVEEHLGSNLPLPASMTQTVHETVDEVVRYEDYVSEMKSQEQVREARHDLQDAFAPVRALIEGSRSLIPSRVYEMMRNTEERVLSSVGIVRSASPFGFMAVAGTDYGAPRWVYLETLTASPTTDLDAICGALRDRLAHDPEDADFDATAAGVLEGMLQQLERHEEALLPRAKRRALQELRHVCGKYAAIESHVEERREVVEDILRFAGVVAGRPRETDLSALASWWLKTIQPMRHRHLADRKRRRPLLLRDLRRELVSNPLSTAQLKTVYEEKLGATPIERRVVAAIIGVAVQ